MRAAFRIRLRAKSVKACVTNNIIILDFLPLVSSFFLFLFGHCHIFNLCLTYNMGSERYNVAFVDSGKPIYHKLIALNKETPKRNKSLGSKNRIDKRPNISDEKSWCLSICLPDIYLCI